MYAAVYIQLLCCLYAAAKKSKSPLMGRGGEREEIKMLYPGSFLPPPLKMRRTRHKYKEDRV